MTTKTEKKVEEKEVKVEEKFKPSDYSCEILFAGGKSLVASKRRSFK